MQKVTSEVNKESISKRRKELLTKGIIIINEDFTDILYERVFFDIVQCMEDNNIPQIAIYINSHGGQVDALLPLVDIIAGSDKPIKTIVTGKAYSAGCMLLLCGHKGHRFALKHSQILMHEVASGADGKITQMKEDVKRVDELNKLLIDIIKKNTKMKAPEIDKFMNSNLDTFITANQALKFGIIDKIL